MTLARSIRIGHGCFTIDLAVDKDGRLAQCPIGCGYEAQATYPTAGDGWVYEPALAVVHSDGNRSTDLRMTACRTEGEVTRIELKDPEYPFFVDLCYRSLLDYDAIECWVEAHHQEGAAVVLEAIASSAPDFGVGEFWLTQFHGDWADEAKMAEEKLGYGIKTLDSKLGVRAHQFRAPWFLLSRGGPADEDRGEVYGGSLAWSGSFRFAFEVLPNGTLRATCGANPYGSAYVLDPGERFVTPKMLWAWSGQGTGELSRKIHRYVMDEVLRDGNRPRAVLLNNWEATYFSFDEQKAIALFDGARDLGMELFLLDDGWFGSRYPRNDDTQGLGDWQVNPEKLPNGLQALTSAAQEKGLRFGLWFEPEMVNPRSELFERHPDWLIQQPKRTQELQRHQMVLDLANPEVREYAFSVLHDTLSHNPGISYVKWDCNRYLTQPGSPFLASDRQANLQIDYVRALYNVMHRVASLHPDVEIMMCSGGGGRVDYGAMRYAHELWPSDMTDPVKRIFIQWGYSYFFPANSLACHVTRWGDRPLKFAFSVAMSGRLGMDVDVEKLSCGQQRFAKDAIAAYKEIRDVVQQGEHYRLESPYEGPRSALMFVKDDRAVAFVYSIGESPAGALILKGLDPSKRYRVRELLSDSGTERLIGGADLMKDGLPLPSYDLYGSGVFELKCVEERRA